MSQNKRWFRICSCVLAVLLGSTQVVGSGLDHWAKEYVTKVVQLGIVLDTERPDDKIQITELTDVLERFVAYKTTLAEPDDSIKKYIQEVWSDSLPEFNNRETKLITREEACVVLAKLVHVHGHKTVAYTDLDAVSSQALPYLNQLNELGIVDGYPDGSFRPDSFITRAEVFKLISALVCEDALYLPVVSTDWEDESEIIAIEPEIIYHHEPNTGFDSFESLKKTSRSKPKQKPLVETDIVKGEPEKNTTLQKEKPKLKVPTLQKEKPKSKVPTLQKEKSKSKVPTISLTATMGSQFRSIDIAVTVADDKDAPQVFYLALERGSQPPSASDIIAYNEGKKSKGLVGGNSVRGNWRAERRDCTTELTLYGKENVKVVENELGFVDGYNYDVYAVAVDDDGNVSEVSNAICVMAMPFHASNLADKTFTLKEISVDAIDNNYQDLRYDGEQNIVGAYRTARQLENIQRLADLSVATAGKHGNLLFLTSNEYTYVLDSDFDLMHYMAGNNESGWTPIGNADRLDEFVFGGSFDGKGHTIDNLYIDRDGFLYNAKYQNQGLFGRVNGATIRNLEINNPFVSVQNIVSKEDSYSGVGCLVGNARNSVIDHITINSPFVSAYSSEMNGLCTVGGVCGNLENTHLSYVVVTNESVNRAGEMNGYSDLTGGVVGRFYSEKAGPILFNNIVVDGKISGFGKAVGGVAGVIDLNSKVPSHIYSQNMSSNVCIDGTALDAGGIAGIIGYENVVSKNASITFENCNSSGQVEGEKAVGGFFGIVRSENKYGVITKKSTANNEVTTGSSYGVSGGFVGVSESGYFEDCRSLGGEIFSQGKDTGGLAGIISGDSVFIGCLSNRTIKGFQNIGGFVGSVQGNCYFESCKVEGERVTAVGASAGGFLGKQRSGILHINNCSTSADVKGAADVGEFIGSLNGKVKKTNSSATGKIVS